MFLHGEKRVQWRVRSARDRQERADPRGTRSAGPWPSTAVGWRGRGSGRSRCGSLGSRRTGRSPSRSRGRESPGPKETLTPTLIRCPDLPESADPNPAPKGVVDFFRSAEGGDGGEAVGPIVSPEPTDSLEHVWFGDGYPMGANKGNVQAYRRQFDAEPRDDLGIDVAVVCNDPKMIDEPAAIAETYGESDDRNFDVTYYREMTTGDLRELLQTEMDFLHYVGHVEPGGIECVDGLVDVNELEWAGPKAFILNGCKSCGQAEALIEKGSLGGVATLTRVGNQSAVEVGKRLAKLLNHGYPLSAGLDVAVDGLNVGGRYVISGDSRVALVKPKGMPIFASIESTTDSYSLQVTEYASGQGTHAIPFIGDNKEYHLSGGQFEELEVSEEELVDYLSMSPIPTRIDGELVWSDDLMNSDYF